MGILSFNEQLQWHDWHGQSEGGGFCPRYVCASFYKLSYIFKHFVGPFTPTWNRAQAVEFSSTIGIMAYYTLIVPLKFRDNILSITDPLSLEVLICFLICIPVYILAMVLMNYFYSGNTNWETAASSVISKQCSNM